MNHAAYRLRTWAGKILLTSWTWWGPRPVKPKKGTVRTYGVLGIWTFLNARCIVLTLSAYTANLASFLVTTLCSNRAVWNGDIELFAMLFDSWVVLCLSTSKSGKNLFITQFPPSPGRPAAMVSLLCCRQWPSRRLKALAVLLVWGFPLFSHLPSVACWLEHCR